MLNEYLSQADGDDHLDTDPEDPQPIAPDDDDPQTEDSNTAMLQNCFSSIVDTLANSNPRYIYSRYTG